jgi:nitroimidazol reductase NimA-like FMN-containing flavoprotein (pyridoxamine 5'-phosphate oxidase superfamily)
LTGPRDDPYDPIIVREMGGFAMSSGQTQAGKEWRGKGGKFSQEELEDFFAGGNVARLACLDDEGWPYVVPTWFHYADGGLYIIPRAKSAWAKYMANDGRVSLTIDEPEAPYRRVQIQGMAELVEEPNVGGKWVPIATEMSKRYLGENGPTYLEPSLVEPRWLFFVSPQKVTTWEGVNWAKKYKHAEWGA